MNMMVVFLEHSVVKLRLFIEHCGE